MRSRSPFAATRPDLRLGRGRRRIGYRASVRRRRAAASSASSLADLDPAEFRQFLEHVTPEEFASDLGETLEGDGDDDERGPGKDRSARQPRSVTETIGAVPLNVAWRNIGPDRRSGYEPVASPPRLEDGEWGDEEPVDRPEGDACDEDRCGPVRHEERKSSRGRSAPRPQVRRAMTTRKAMKAPARLESHPSGTRPCSFVGFQFPNADSARS